MTRSLRKVGVVAMALMMVFAMAVGAFADTTPSIPTSGDVEILKDGSSTASMADGAVATDEDGNKLPYTATVSQDGNTVTVSIPIQRVYKMGFYGYIKDSSTITLNGTAVPFTVTAAPYDDGGTLTLTLPASAFIDGENIVSSVKLDVTFDLALYGSTSLTHKEISSMDAVADLYLYPAA